MSPKRSAPSKASGKEPKRQRKVMTLHEKVKLLDMLAEGKPFAAVARHYGLNESTVRYIKKGEANIRSTVAVTCIQNAKRTATKRNKYIVRMEAALGIWIKDCRKKNIPLDTNVIREKARQLYEQLAGEASAQSHAEDDPQPGTSKAPEEHITFHASKGWFDRFQKRFQLKSVPLHGEAASADVEGAKKYPRTLKKSFAIIEDNGYLPEQVFNMDETGLFWKKMPSRTFIMKDEARTPGFKAQKDRVTLILCGNAAGFLMKPALIYKSANPRALKRKNKNLLPVHWMHNPKAWITEALVSDWFFHCFIPAAKMYLREKGLPFKVLLAMDNAVRHPLDLSYEGVQIVFLPANTTSLIQPLDQGFIRTFKALYTKNLMQHLVEAMDSCSNFLLKEFWRQFTIETCLQVIQRVLQELKPETLNACWKKLWPECVHDHKGFSPEETQHSAVEKAVKLAKILGGEGFDDMTTEDVNFLIDAHSDPLTDEDLAELMKSAGEEEEEQGDPSQEEEEEDEGLSLERLEIMMKTAKELQGMAELWDPSMVRIMQFKNAIDSAMQSYKSLFATMKQQRQQLPITMFFQTVNKTSDDPPQKHMPASDSSLNSPDDFPPLKEQ
ncbi:hypothetical protein C0J45_9963 [Silurus meridionalis]|nr:hypothetical protein C0J45_9963 [Silurus meridionalis]